MTTVLRFLSDYWLLFATVGIYVWAKLDFPEKASNPILDASLRSFSRFAISVPIALAGGVPVAFFFALILGNAGVLLVLVIAIIALLVWSSIPLIRAIYADTPRYKSEANDVPKDIEKQAATELESVPASVAISEPVVSTESTPVLEAADVQKFIASASKRRIISANANRTEVSRFFNAIRYGKTKEVRKAVSANPLLLLAKDVYGNTPVTAAEQENNIELRTFFKECFATE